MTIQPYPGLRAYNEKEDAVFFGRSSQKKELLRKLRNSSFLAILGPSGAGKSSLLKAGLIPSLHAGFLDRKEPLWEIATMRPGKSPIQYLAESLWLGDLWPKVEKRKPSNEQINKNNVKKIEKLTKRLRRTPLSLMTDLRLYREDQDPRLLLIIDQFEELFTVCEEDECRIFVDIILEAAFQASDAIHVIVTMRSDFLDNCFVYTDLGDAICDNIFLIPRLSGEDLGHALSLPAKVCGGSVDPAVIGELLMLTRMKRIDFRYSSRYSNDEYQKMLADELFLLQYFMKHVWDKSGSDGSGHKITLEHLRELPHPDDLLNQQLDEIYEDLDDKSKHIVKIAFKLLTEYEPSRDRLTRRPNISIKDIADIVGIDAEKAYKAIEPFLDADVLIDHTKKEKFDYDDIDLDISHEAVIRNWRLLEKWAKEEAENARMLKELLEEKSKKYCESGQNNSFLITGAYLEEAEQWEEELLKNKNINTIKWCQRYLKSPDVYKSNKNLYLDWLKLQIKSIEKFINHSRGKDLADAIKTGSMETIQERMKEGVTLTAEQIKKLPHKVFYYALYPQALKNEPSLKQQDLDKKDAHLSSIFPRGYSNKSKTNVQEVTRSQVIKYFTKENVFHQPEKKDVLRVGTGYTPAHFAALAGELDVLETLKAIGCKLWEKTEKESTPFMKAVYGGQKETAKWLRNRWLENNKGLSDKDIASQGDKENRTPLSWAADRGHYDTLCWLLDEVGIEDIDPQTCEPNDSGLVKVTPLHLACWYGKTKIVEKLLEKGLEKKKTLDINAEDSGKHTPIMWAAAGIWGDTVKVLLDNELEKPDLSVLNRDDNTAILEAVSRKDNKTQPDQRIQVIESLLRAGADVNDVAGKSGISVLQYAIMNTQAKCREEVIEFLIKKKAYIDHLDKKGQSAVTHALREELEDVAIYMIKKGTRIASKEEKRRLQEETWFLEAIRYGCIKVAIWQINHGISLDEHGHKAMIEAVRNKQWGFVNFLKYRKVDIPGKTSWLDLCFNSEGDIYDIQKITIDLIQKTIFGYLSESTSPEWPLAPLIDGNWEIMEYKEAREIVENIFKNKFRSFLIHENLYEPIDIDTRTCLEKTKLTGIDALRRRRLGFYKDAYLYEARGLIGKKFYGNFTFLVHPDGQTLLNGNSLPIHELNKKRKLDLNEENNVKEYLRFFCSAVHWKEGAFVIFENKDQLLPLETMQPEDIEKAEKLATPIKTKESETNEADKPWYMSAMVKYGNAIFETEFKIHRDGMVEMLSDKPLAANLDLSVEVFEEGVRNLRSIISD